MPKSIKLDIWLIAPVLILLLVSLTILRSVSPQQVGNHVLFAAVSIGIYFLVANIDYKIFASFSRFLYAISIGLLLITLFIGVSQHGSTRWLQLGPISFQPSELVKPLIVISLAKFVSQINLKKSKDLFFYAILSFIPVFLVFLQPDLGSALVLVVISASLAFAAGLQLRFIAIAIVLTIVSFPLALQLLKPYQQERINAFIDPYADPLGSGYTIIQSIIAVGSGKIFGRGLGHGTQSQLHYLPERHSDFIFASIAEEMGFIGSMIVITSFTVLISRLLIISKATDDYYGKLLTIGIFSMLLFQISENIGMNLGLLPITGITLPLISLGGSSLLVTIASLGIIQSVSQQSKASKTIEIR